MRTWCKITRHSRKRKEPLAKVTSLQLAEFEMSEGNEKEDITDRSKIEVP